MPVLSQFFGITIKMYFKGSEHNPPHIHAFYKDDVAAFDIQTGEILDGYLPSKESSDIRKWLLAHKAELLQMWESQKFFKIEPLE